jgi:hypothetical protein
LLMSKDPMSWRDWENMESGSMKSEQTRTTLIVVFGMLDEISLCNAFDLTSSPLAPLPLSDRRGEEGWLKAEVLG